ncbi:MAG: CRTAC1 family protein [Phycisphaerales bacterium]|nr:CRTAC1 family protein [Phycisphaerales bacterium]
MRTIPIIVACCAGTVWGQLTFLDATSDLGFGGLTAPHCCFVDLNNDGRPDAVVGRDRVFLNVADDAAPRKLRFVEVEHNGLPVFRTGDIAVFADLDNDGIKDCVWTRYLDVNAEKYEAPTEGPPKTAWLRGNGDGTFGQPAGTWTVIGAAQEATTAAVAVGDVDRDGWLDLYLGNWYVKYPESLEGFTNELLLQSRDRSGEFLPERVDYTVDEIRHALDFDKDDLRISGVPASEVYAHADFEADDLGGRPTYGVMLPQLLGHQEPMCLDLNYGRRWNRLWQRTIAQYHAPGRADIVTSAIWEDLAPKCGIDGDDIRHGRYPDWLKERAKADPRFPSDDEKPFRANGNTFDAAVGDIDNDGDFDLFLAEITHSWAGESSDRSRFLVQEPDADGAPHFVSRPGLSVDRVPTDPTVQSWNQGDIFCELADFDLDGRLDLLLCSSDYPDNQRLRVYRQQVDGSFIDMTSWVGIDHIGALQPSLADIDGDGDLDILVGQGFNRLRADQREGRQAHLHAYVNQAADKGLGHALVLRLVGDEGKGVSRDALGAIVRVTATIGGRTVTQARQIIGIGGHEGKQMDFTAHFGLGDAERAERVEIEWPARDRMVTVLDGLDAGAHTVRLTESEVQR